MKPELLILSPLRENQMAQLEDLYSLHRYDLSSTPDLLVDSVAPHIEVVATGGSVGFTRALAERLPNLKAVCSLGVGYDAIDMDVCHERGIKVTNTPDVLNDDVADLAIGLMLAVRRKLVVGDAYVRSGEWGRSGPMPLLSSTKGKKLGIAGFGRIGRAIAARAEPMGLEIGYFARSKRENVSYPFFKNLEDLASWCEIMIAVVPGGPSTDGLFSKAVFEAIGPTGTFINIARGSVVDEAAMISALKERRLGSAGLDVYLNEPQPDPAFAELSNVVLHPHHASGTIETRDAMSQLVVDNINAYYSGKPLLTEVT